MKSLGAKKLVTVVTALVIVLLTGMHMSGRQFSAQLASRQWVLSTYSVLNQIDSLLLNLKSLEASQSSYILFADERSLRACQLYSATSQTLTKTISALEQDNPQQVVKAKILQDSVTQMLTRVQKTIEIRQTKGLDAAKDALLYDTTSSAEESGVEDVAHQMSAIEKQLLEKRLAALNTATERTQEHVNFVNALFIVSLLLIVWLYSRSREKIQKSLALQHAISRILNESEDLFHAIRKIEELVAAHGQWSCAATWLLNENENALRCFDVYHEPWLNNSPFIDETRQCKFVKGEGLPGRVWQNEEAAAIVLLSKDSNFPRKKLAQECKLTSGFAFPIISNKNFFGVVEVFSDHKQTLDHETLSTFESIGREIGRLIERQRSQMRFRAIFNQTYEFIGFLDTEGNLLDVNEPALKFVNIERQDVLHRPFWEGPWWSHDAAQQAKLKDAVQKAASGEFCRFEASHLAPDGTTAYVDFSLKPVFDSDGEVKYLIPEGRDISEKKAAEIKFRAVFDQTYGFIGLLRPDGIIQDYNKSALDFAGVNLNDVVGKPLWETAIWSHDPTSQDTLKQAIAQAAAGEFVRFESKVPSSSGELFDFDVSIKPVIDQYGKVGLLIPEARNITQAKAAEQRVSEFYSTVSHELRSPLTSIRGSLGLMEGGLTGTLPETTLKMVQIARSECDRLIRLINDILDLQKIEAGMVELKRSNIDTSRLIERAVEGLRGMAHTLNISLVAIVDTSQIVNCDEDRIIQVLTNLISNALKFSPSGAKVSVEVEPGPGGTIRFNVKDNGPGISPEQSHKLFARFQQLDQSDSRQKGGTGLGLAITKAIVEEHGGTIGVESVAGHGSNFWFCLPSAS
jgi:PAS domain S-box-containing protein